MNSPNFILRFAIWLILCGLVGLFAGALVSAAVPRSRAFSDASMTAAGTIAGAIGAAAQEIARALRDRK